MSEDELKTELERAYRCIQGMHKALVDAHIQTASMAYHAPTIGAAKRFVFLGALDGAEYFIGKDVGELHKAMALSAVTMNPLESME